MTNNIILLITISFIVYFLVSSISYKLNLLDRPNKRKTHIKATAYTGGLALSVIYLFSVYIFDFVDSRLTYIFSIGFLIGIVGFIDDLKDLSVGGKLSLQIIPIIYLILDKNLNLDQIGDYDFFVLELNSFSIPFTLLCVIFLINSFNYFDGLDGVLGFTTISTLSILIFLTKNSNIQIFLIVTLIPILIFLVFNFSIFKLPKLFFGDSGSLLLGFVISFILIILAIEKVTHPILLAYSVSIFVYEFLAINLIRMQANKKIFDAGFDHLHHILWKKYKSMSITNFLISILNIIFFIFGYLSFKFINTLSSLVIFLFLFIIYFILRKKLT